jgi:hypothetical protein
MPEVKRQPLKTVVTAGGSLCNIRPCRVCNDEGVAMRTHTHRIYSLEPFEQEITL